MQTASYVTVKTETGGSGKYPLSTQTLDFIQGQILLLQHLAFIGGKRYVLREPDGESPGVVVVDGEVMLLSAKPVRGEGIRYVCVTTETIDVEADGETYVAARRVRRAYYSSVKSEECYDVNEFDNFSPNTTLSAQVKQLPQTVLGYLRDVISQKLSCLEVKGLTQEKLDGLVMPCLLSCEDSLSVEGASRYSLMVTCQGGLVRQEVKHVDGRVFYRIYDGDAWDRWREETENLHVELRVTGDRLWVRHGALPDGLSLVLLRKRRRGKWRSTGGENALEKNRGKRLARRQKTQYVHYKGIVLSKGVAGKWYEPHCVRVMDEKKDLGLIDRKIPDLCASLMYEKEANLWRVQGVRNRVSTRNGKGFQHRAYVPMGVQLCRLSGNYGKSAGGEMICFKYRIFRERVKGEDGSVSYVWHRRFSLG